MAAAVPALRRRKRNGLALHGQNGVKIVKVSLSASHNSVYYTEVRF